MCEGTEKGTKNPWVKDGLRKEMHSASGPVLTGFLLALLLI